MSRIYTACLASYNNGRLHGSWIDADLGADHIRQKIDEMLKASPEPGAEEWAIHDYEGFGNHKVSESADLDTVADLAAAIEKHGEIFADFLDHIGADDISEAERRFEDAYRGEYKSVEDYAEQYLDDTGMLSSIPENLRYYFDVEKFARDMELNGDIFTIEKGYNEVHVFDNY